ncbi:class I SAM-dependent methyltransferase [Patescibacteria group bacterium]|nr:class I SAM-dependent methyltransferase [Patescibacteria group bacterium]
MDVFGEVLKAYSKGDRSKFYFKDSSGELSERSLKRYFRKTNQLSRLEYRLINLSYGDILDVGCGTGNYIPLLAKHGQVLRIDISQNVIDVAKMNGCKTCVVADIFNSHERKFDTITCFENNLGIGETIEKTSELLRKLSSLLKK